MTRIPIGGEEGEESSGGGDGSRGTAAVEKSGGHFCHIIF